MDRALPFLVLLLIIGGISAAVHSKQATQRLMARIVLATLLIGLVGMSVIPIFFVHYTLFWIIPMIVLLCLALDALSEWRPAVTKGILIMLALFAVWNVTSSVMHITAIREGEEVLEYGYRYPYMREVADYLITHPEIKSIACSEEQACIVIPYLVEKEGRSVSTVGIEQADVFIQDLRHGEQRPVPSTEILLRNRLYTVLDLY